MSGLLDKCIVSGLVVALDGCDTPPLPSVPQTINTGAEGVLKTNAVAVEVSGMATSVAAWAKVTQPPQSSISYYACKIRVFLRVFPHQTAWDIVSIAVDCLSGVLAVNHQHGRRALPASVEAQIRRAGDHSGWGLFFVGWGVFLIQVVSKRLLGRSSL